MANKVMKKMFSGGLIMLVALAMSGFYLVQRAKADGLSSKSDVLSRLQDNTAANHTITFTTTTAVAVGETITVTFPGDFDTSTIVFGDVDVKDDAVEMTLGANCDATEDASAVMAADVLTVTICSDYAAGIGGGSVVEIQIGTHAAGPGTHQIVNPNVAVDTTYEIAIDATTDDGQVEVQILMDDTMHITATVDESIAFDIIDAGSDMTIGFGDLSSSVGRWATGDAVGENASDTTPTAAHTMTIGTNADGGWAITFYGPTLTDGSNTIDVADIVGAAGTYDGTPGSEEFGLCASTDGNSTVNTLYERDATPDWKFVASTVTTLVSESAPTATETISVSYLGNISTLTEPGSYEADVTYIATATF